MYYTWNSIISHVKRSELERKKTTTLWHSRNNEMSFCPVFFLTVHISSYFYLVGYASLFSLIGLDIFAQIFRSPARSHKHYPAGHAFQLNNHFP